VMGYVDAILQRQPIGQRVAVIGAGGIGFDVASFLVHRRHASVPALDLAAWQREWGVTDPRRAWRRGARAAGSAGAAGDAAAAQAWQLGAGLGKTTGWIHRSALKMKGVEMVAGAHYETHRSARRVLVCS